MNQILSWQSTLPAHGVRSSLARQASRSPLSGRFNMVIQPPMGRSNGPGAVQPAPQSCPIILQFAGLSRARVAALKGVAREYLPAGQAICPPGLP